MTDDDHVKAIHVLSTANPLPTIASFEFSPQSGLAVVSSRLRLAPWRTRLFVGCDVGPRRPC